MRRPGMSGLALWLLSLAMLLGVCTDWAIGGFTQRDNLTGEGAFLLLCAQGALLLVHATWRWARDRIPGRLEVRWRSYRRPGVGRSPAWFSLEDED